MGLRSIEELDLQAAATSRCGVSATSRSCGCDEFEFSGVESVLTDANGEAIYGLVGVKDKSLIKGEVDNGTSSAVRNINQQLEDSERKEVIRFSKRYFGQVGRNYRVFYMKDERMTYLHRMWFDQVRTPAQTIKKDFPSIFNQEGCCFTAEKEFFMVIPGTPVYKLTGPYKFER